MEPLTEGRKSRSGRLSTARRLKLAMVAVTIIRTWDRCWGDLTTFRIRQEIERVTGSEWDPRDVALALKLIRRRKLAYCTGARTVAVYHPSTSATTTKETP